MRTAAVPTLRDQAPPVPAAGAPARLGPRLRVLPRWSAPMGEALGYRLALLGVHAIGLLTGTVIGLFWYPAAAVVAMFAAALVSRSDSG